MPVLNGFKERLDGNKAKHLPKSGLSKAINYVLNQWEELNVYVEDGRLPISNCLCVIPIRMVSWNWRVCYLVSVCTATERQGLSANLWHTSGCPNLRRAAVARHLCGSH